MSTNTQSLPIRIKKPLILDKISHENHAIIEASAGTGKTYTIEHMVVDLLIKNPGLRIHQILVVTFTERATFELRARIRKLLQAIIDEAPQSVEEDPAEPAWEIGPTEKKNLQMALTAFDLAPIHTIHGFCHRVLVENAFQNHRPFEQEHASFELIYDFVFTETLRQEFARREDLRPILAAWLTYKPGGLEDLKKLLARCIRHRGAIAPTFDQTTFLDALAALKSLDPEEAPTLIHTKLRQEKVHHSTARALRQRITELLLITQRWQQDGDHWAALGALDDGKHLSYMRERLDLLDLAGAPGELLKIFYNTTSGLEAVVAASFLAPLKKMLRDFKDLSGQFSFDDMLSLVWESLESERGELLLDTLRQRFRFALIDEFQDTDDLQWKIFGRIFHQSGGENICYLIGDPKQAIYSFRGADIHTYLHAREALTSAGAPLIPLAKNYRSSADVIAAYNHLFDQQAPTPFFTGDITYDHPVACGLPERRVLGPDAQPTRPIHLVQLTGESLKSADVQDGFAAFIAAEISALLSDQHRLWVHDPDDAAPRAITPKDIFILTRARHEGLLVAEHLRQAGVPFAFFKQDGLFQTDEARHIYDLLGAILRPEDRSARLKAWLTPFFELSLSDLTKTEHLDPEHPLLADLHAWNQLARARHFESLFNSILERTGLLRRQIFAGRGEREITNYLHLFELLLEQARQEKSRLGELVIQLGAYINESAEPPGEDGNIQRLESDEQAVQIMTMHKAKGLEAEVVFLFGGLNLRSSKTDLVYHDDDSNYVLHLGEAPPEVVARHRQEQAEEDQRLIYVALTRAKSKLYLPYLGFEQALAEEKSAALKKAADKDKKSKPHKRNVKKTAKLKRDFKVTGGYRAILQRLDEVVDALKDNPQATTNDGQKLRDLFELERLEYTRVLRLQDEAARQKALINWRPPNNLPSPLPDADFAPLRRRRPQISSYTRIKDAQGGLNPQADARLIGLNPDEFRADAGEQIEAILGPDGLPGGTHTGIFLHDLLENADLETAQKITSLDAWTKDPKVEHTIKKSMNLFAIDPKYLDFCKKLVWRALKTPLIAAQSENNSPDTPSLGCVTSFDQTLRELEFLYPINPDTLPQVLTDLSGTLDFKDDFITGFIDLIFQADGKFYWADWKSDILVDYTQPTLHACVAARYNIQATIYTLAMVKFLEILDEADYNARFGGHFYLFIRGMGHSQASRGIYHRRPSWREVLEFEKTLTKTV